MPPPTEPNASISVPRPPEPPQPTRFPLIATLAPVAASLVMFAVTRSPFALVFAVLGPVVAVGGLVDARIQRRRSNRRETARFDAECTEARRRIKQTLAAERVRLHRRWPAVSASSAPGFAGSDSVQSAARADTVVRIGTGRVASGIDFRVDRATALPGGIELSELSELAAFVSDAPVRVDVGAGVTVVGELSVALACARAVVLQLATRLSPESFRIEGATGTDWEWASELPHRREEADRRENEVVFIRRRTRSGTPAVFDAATGEVRVSVGAPGSVVRSGTRLEVGPRGQGRIVAEGAESPFRADLVGTVQARTIATALSVAWSAGAANGPLPDHVAFADITVSEVETRPGMGLASALGQSGRGKVEVDLVTAGPHAVVGGTTGSGKSELLLSWILGMAARYSPDAVTFLFVDFKGGASFEALARLPHSVGVVTDLDAEQSGRALASLSAELRHRERVLARSGRRSIDDVRGQQVPVDDGSPMASVDANGPLARLVVVVDEYAAVVDGDAALHRLFLDLAARGRSLGVHLILCTQRPSGVVREGILANAGLRISMRVTNAADSSAIVGTDIAATLPASPRRRAVVTEVGGAPLEFQVALSTPDDVARVVAIWSQSMPPRRPWCPPLPARIPLDREEGRDVREGDTKGFAGIEFGVSDIPQEQRRDGACWVPERDGSLVIVGATGSGKSTALATLAAAESPVRSLVIEPTLAAVWDALTYALELIESRVDDPRPHPTVLLLDDLDAIVAAAPADYDIELCDRLATVLRTGPPRGVAIAAAVQRVGGPLGSALTLCGSRLVLRLADRAEHLLAGGEGSTFSDRLPPGGGWWRGLRTQIFDPSAHRDRIERWNAATADPSLADMSLADVFGAHDAHTPVSVVSTRPERILAELATTPLAVAGAKLRFERVGEQQRTPSPKPPGHLSVRIGEPQAWQADWAAHAALRHSIVLFDSCSVADLRAMLGSRVLPPPFPRRESPRWVVTTDGVLRRVRG